MLITLSRLVLFILIISVQSFSWAESPEQAGGLFGPEWTFTNRHLIKRTDHNYKVALIKTWREHIKEICPNCYQEYSNERSSFYGQYTINYNKEQKFAITSDPLVIEIKASPLTVKEFKENMNKLQTLIWDTGKHLGVQPHSRVGGGHIHVDIKTNFGNNTLLQRNFIVDLFNHPELFMGALSLDYLNAPPLAFFPPDQISIIEKALRNFDNNNLNLDELKERIIEVYRKSKIIEPSAKYRAVNFNHRDTIEVRGFRPQASARHYFDMITLLESRIEFLRGINTPIPLNVPDYHNAYAYTITSVNKLHKYTTSISSQRVVDVYKKFVEETGLIDNHKNLATLA